MKLLLAEDEFISRKLLSERLRTWGFEVVPAGDGREALAALDAPDSPRLAILDWEMPGCTGPAICRELRARRREGYVYTILLTAKSGRDARIAGLDAGADDFVRKPVDLEELELRLRTARRILDLEARLVEARDAFQFQATHDALTKVLNRRGILDVLRAELARADRGQPGPAVVLADVDHFKRINDDHGHAGGDVVLAEIARRFVAAIRPYDAVGRYGGEEFLVVLPACDRSAAFGVAERLRQAVAAAPIALPAARPAVTSSFGVAVSAPGVSMEALLQLADEALYAAKRGGRDRVEGQEPPPGPPAPGV
jgi:diguanylate cyclase (GGDEF)-like protein